MSLQEPVFNYFGNIWEVEYLGYMIVLFLIVLVTSILFSIVAVSIYNPINTVQGFPPSTSLLTLVC